MNEQTRQRLMDKNQKLIDMVIERIKRDCRDDIAIVGLTGSFSTGDYHEKSDLDLIIINNTPKGWEIAFCFILDDVGYDIYCTPWETRIQEESTLNSPMVSCLVDLVILYCAKQEYLERLKGYQKRALELLAEPIGPACLQRAGKQIDEAKKAYADAMLASALGDVRYAAGNVLYHAINAITGMNNTYIQRGIKRYLQQLLGYAHIPEDFEALYWAVIRADGVDALRDAAGNLLRSVARLHQRMSEQFINRPVPTYENTWGTYEELWCNCRNKVINSTSIGDASYAFHAAIGAQAYLNEMRGMIGTPAFDLMGSFDACDLTKLQEAFLRITDQYEEVYRAVGRKVERFDSFEALYDRYMGAPNSRT